MGWDSRVLGISVGKLPIADAEKCEMGSYDLLLARVPQQQSELVRQLESHGFRYIAMDVTLQAAAKTADISVKNPIWQVSRLSRSTPTFEIDGFVIEDSRLMLDPLCKNLLPEAFWDSVIREHCEEFADIVLYATDDQNRLTGFISCLKTPKYLDLFLVAVHPRCQGAGLGSILIDHALQLGDELGLPVTTSVIANNVRGFNFYLKHNFLVKGSEVIMHRWRDGGGHEH
jgi:ribosomal protein S18 acetylase RimI-like enzyme